jgi:23S rRNA pseudouridine1911/1915/1917 synthase
MDMSPRDESGLLPAVELDVTAAEAGVRLDAFLAAHFGSISRMRLRQAIAEGDVMVNAARRTAGWKLRAGDRIQTRLADVGPTAMTPEVIPIPVVYEDAGLAVIEKPAGMVAHPTAHWRSGTLVNALAHQFNRTTGGRIIRPGLVHRLDRLTSGLMVVAKSDAVLTRLTSAFQARQVEKRYGALVHGEVAPDSGTIDAPIGRDADVRPRWGVRAGGRPAETRFRVVERFSHATLLEMEPVTGRTNQLRIHAAHAGHPILGDPEFGLEWAVQNARFLPMPPTRLFLHASRLAFRHPASGAWLEFTSALPVEMDSSLTALREAAKD